MTNLLHFIERKNTREEAVTLVEIVVAIMIVGILVAVGIGIWRAQEKNGINASIKSELKAAANAMHAMAAKTKDTFPSIYQLM
jgi:type II secretory pathway pseudopilin PulG